MRTPERILVFRNGSIGNTLAALPAIKCLRESFPNSHIEVVVDNVGEELLANVPWFNSLTVYDRSGFDQGLSGFIRTATRLRNVNPDTAILFKRFFRNGLLARLSGATCRVGFETNGKAPFLNEVIPYDESVHVAELNLRLVRKIGASATVSLLPEIFVTTAEQEQAKDWLRKHNIRNEYIIAHFGGVTSGAEFVSQSLRVRLLLSLAPDLPIVVIGNGLHEQETAIKLAESIPSIVNATGLALRETISLIAGASRFIGTNSGPMHIAAASRVPGIALFHDNPRLEVERVKWRPLFEGLKIVPVHPDAKPEQIIDLARQAWQ